jgi:AcrR family transcriptional regulator
MSPAPSERVRAKPLKRPSQARARFTVQAIYDAFVRIWKSEGWERLTTRAVALETGISVGTLYEYFPNKQALLSGYVRHCMETLQVAIEEQVVQAADLPWQQRLHRLLRLTCGVDAPEMPHFDADMLALEHQIAELKHHRRVHDELLAAWSKALAACTDLPFTPAASTVRTMYLSAWGARRYLLLIKASHAASVAWAAELERQYETLLRAAPGPANGTGQPG